MQLAKQQDLLVAAALDGDVVGMLAFEGAHRCSA
jgi:hypothetical protein